MSDIHSFIKSQSVLSKLSEKPVVRQWEHLTLVFAHGYPMTLRAFYILCNKAVFGNTLNFRGSVWNELHAETKLLCYGLNINLTEGREAFSVLEGIRKAAGWNQQSAEKCLGYGYKSAENPMLVWIEAVERQVAALQGITLPGPQLRSEV